MFNGFVKRILSIVLLLNITCLSALSSVIYKSGNLYGLKDDSGKVILNSEYQLIEQLSYIPSKKVVIPMHSMDEVSTKTLDLYKIKKNNLYGVASSDGKIKYECSYKNVEADENGDIKFTLSDGSIKYAHPVSNAAKAARDTVISVVGLPVTIIGVMMMPIEAISKVGQK